MLLVVGVVVVVVVVVLVRVLVLVVVVVVVVVGPAAVVVGAVFRWEDCVPERLETKQHYNLV